MSSDSDFRVRTVNANTLFGDQLGNFEGLFRGSRVDLHAAYGIARGLTFSRGLLAEPGHRLVWIRGDAVSSTVVGEASSYVIVGRHAKCQAILPDDPTIALRHLLLRSNAQPDGSVTLRIVDLHTETGFLLADGSKQRSILAEGPVAIQVGEYALVAIPAWSSLPLALELPALQVNASDASSSSAGESPYRANARSHAVSRITLMPNLLVLGEAPRAQMAVTRTGVGTTYVLKVVSRGASAKVLVDNADLDRGIVVGRSLKCHSESLRRLTSLGTSRLHLLIARDRGVIYAYDLASTHGTTASGARVRRHPLLDGGTTLTLGDGGRGVGLHWARCS